MPVIITPDIRTSFGETDSFLYMCIENIPVIRTSNIGYKKISDIRTYSLIHDNVLITGIDCIYVLYNYINSNIYILLSKPVSTDIH